MKGILLYIGAVIILSGCSFPGDLGLPSWYTTMRVIFLNDIYDMEEIAEEDSALIVQNGELVFMEVIEESQMLGDIEIFEPGERDFQLTVDELMPDSLQNTYPPDTWLVIPSFGMEPTIEELTPYSEFASATFSSGLINVSLTNNTAIGLGNQAENAPLMAEIFNQYSNELILSLQVEDILPGETSLVEYDLAGITFSNALNIMIAGGSTGSGGELVYTDDSFFNSALDINITYENIYVSDITGAEIPVQEIDDISDIYELEIEYPEIIGEIAFTGYSEINITVNSIIPGEIMLDLVAENSDDSTTVMLQTWEGGGEHSLTAQIEAGTTEIYLTSDEYNINALISILPDLFDYDVFCTIGDTTQTYDLTSEDEVILDISISSQIQFNTGENGLWIIPQEDGEIQISTFDTVDYEQEQYDSFRSGSLKLYYINPTGVEMAAQILVSEQEQFILDNIYEIVSPDTNEVQIFDIPLIETTNDSIFGEVEFVIQQYETEVFLEDSVFIATRFYLFSEGLEPLNGGIHMIGELFLELLINEDLINEEDN